MIEFVMFYFGGWNLQIRAFGERMDRDRDFAEREDRAFADREEVECGGELKERFALIGENRDANDDRELQERKNNFGLNWNHWFLMRFEVAEEDVRDELKVVENREHDDDADRKDFVREKWVIRGKTSRGDQKGERDDEWMELRNDGNLEWVKMEELKWVRKDCHLRLEDGEADLDHAYASCYRRRLAIVFTMIQFGRFCSMKSERSNPN
jgi:hypothetical protein